MAKSNEETTPAFRWIGVCLLLPLCLFITLSLFSYDWQDIGMLQDPPNNPPANLIGPIGAWLSFILFTALGVGAYFVPVYCLLFGVILILGKEDRLWPRALWGIVMIIALAWIAELYEATWVQTCRNLNIDDAGGISGYLIIRSFLIKLLSPVGTGILIWSLLAVSLLMFAGTGNIIAVGRRVGSLFLRGIERFRVYWEQRQDKMQLIEKKGRVIEKQRRRLEKTIQKQERIERTRPKQAEPKPEPEQEQPKPRVVEKEKKWKRQKEKPSSEPEKTATASSMFELPPLDLLAEKVQSSGEKAIKVDTTTTSRILTETLAEFGIEAEVTNFQKGPVVTRYELLPAPGVRVERIAGLSNNLALSLKSTSVRVQAPIPGKGVVGIEVPNITANTVYLREIIESETWQAGKATLPLALGKDVAGNDIVGDLAEMPHLLIAGATGAGKTVCMNTLLTGLLMSKTPDQMRLMLIDPKIVEFSVYNGLPHLVVPVITNPKKVVFGLRWAINEMEKRYKLFAKVGVRNIETYNNRVIPKQQDMFDPESAKEEKKDEPPDKIPYIVIVIDELADLMLAAQMEIENCIARLAQLSRAVGIHMILSTQRPSVNVITGTIKANFPARIAFQVAQKVDSRTILDTMGADKLLGSGDMLFLPPGTSKLTRAQGAICKDQEIRDIVEFIKAQGEPMYEIEIKQKIEKKGAHIEEAEEDEDLINTAIQVIKETQRASTSSLQRRLRIGYTRAARIMDILEERGMVGPPRGSDPREILIDLDGDIPDNPTEEQSEEPTEEQSEE
ncbi:DNA translocase FtsK 4TM domain-containing protein [Verrucomicrobiota bacterium]